MSWILIQNDGEIELGAFELIGASTKRNQQGKIGFFGSGLKYSIAYMMRANIGFRIFSGERELTFTSSREVLRNQDFERICINGNPTSYTTTMGPTWKEAWFIIREIYCNALDETNCQMVKHTDNINAIEGKTRIYIELNPELDKMINQWDAYFSLDREPLFTDNIYTSSLGSEEIIPSGSYYARQNTNVLRKTEGVVYRKGVRVYVNAGLLYDYDFSWVNINEDRTVKNTYPLAYAFADLMGRFSDENYVTSILRTGAEETPCREYRDINSTSPESALSEKWVDYSKKYLLVVKEISGRYVEQMSRSAKEVLLIPAHFAKRLKQNLPDTDILGLGKSVDDVFMSEIESTPKMNFLLKEVIKSLEEMKYHISYPIHVVAFEDEKILGHADIKEKQIYLSSQIFDAGRREIALTLIEETEHIISQAHDETRKFESHLISLSLKIMEENAGLFL